MTRFLVAAVDGAKARFLTLEPLITPEFESGPDLVERCTLANPALEMAGQDLWANPKTGRNRSGGSQGHNYDDHRNNHLVEFERRFAQAIVGRMDEMIAENSLNTVILVAEPQILGILRETLPSIQGRSVQIHDMAKDLCWMKPRQLHDYLAQKDMLPAHKVVMTGSRAR